MGVLWGRLSAIIYIRLFSYERAIWKNSYFIDTIDNALERVNALWIPRYCSRNISYMIL
jgi:hypothetical protein